MKLAFVLALVAVAGTGVWVAVEAGADEVDPGELPRIPPLTSEESLRVIDVRPGFAVELVAHEPLVVDPVAACFDEDGALYVVEMRGYPLRREDALGRVKKLIDADGDGFFETATIYAEDLKWPTGVLCYDGGIFVTASPDVLWFEDGDGDGVADGRTVAFTGLGSPRLNVQALCNSLRWGPDNRVWVATSHNGGSLRRGGEPEGRQCGSAVGMFPSIRKPGSFGWRISVRSSA